MPILTRSDWLCKARVAGSSRWGKRQAARLRAGSLTTVSVRGGRNCDRQQRRYGEHRLLPQGDNLKLGSTSRVGNGAYSIIGYDDTETVFVEARERTLIARSDDGVMVASRRPWPSISAT